LLEASISEIIHDTRLNAKRFIRQVLDWIDRSNENRSLFRTKHSLRRPSHLAEYWKRCTQTSRTGGMVGWKGRTEDQISPPSPLLPPPTYLAPRPIQKWHPYPRNWDKDTLASWPAIKGSVQSYRTATNRPQRMQMLMVALWQRKRDPILPPDNSFHNDRIVPLSVVIYY